MLFFIMAQRAGGTGVMIPEKSRCPTLTHPTPAFKAALWHLVRDSAATFAHGFLL